MEPLSLRGVSLQPPGDVISVEVTNRRLAAVMRLADRCGVGQESSVSLSTSRPASVLSAGRQDDALQDITSGTAEEIELDIGRESTMTPARPGVDRAQPRLAARPDRHRQGVCRPGGRRRSQCRRLRRVRHRRAR
ncbi:hypothetical protein [Modestobacter sp. KNN46-3]|uniref:hypothetical protein n=1 Tax=Modestobacter sp. KNN46-3 TaxID=2711218 RepID=UPI001F14BC7D|nr:hypothetical protein [Modestobacter sp. KNN46-3]